VNTWHHISKQFNQAQTVDALMKPNCHHQTSFAHAAPGHKIDMIPSKERPVWLIPRFGRSLDVGSIDSSFFFLLSDLVKISPIMKFFFKPSTA
jgi:hypothetical protein